MRPVRASASPLVFLVFVVQTFVHAVPRPRTWMSVHRNGGLGHPNRTQGVTKVQVEDLDEASTGCVRLRELDFCGGADGRGGPSWGTARYPNALGHTSEAEAKASVKDFAVLLSDLTCGHSLRPFLCAALTPACNAGGDDSPAALPPCRSICSAAVEGCEEALRGRGVQWPSEWSCDLFPTDGVCIDRPVRPSGGSDRGLNDGGRSQLDWSQTHSIKSRGSLEPPPSSAIDEELLAQEDDDVPRRPENPPTATGRRRPPPPDQTSGDHRFFRGWVDVQGTGTPNDYCRVLGTRPDDRFLSCALNGTGSERAYISKRGFDVGHPGTWFMKDSDADGRDDYCRCVGRKEAQLICMKAGENGFYGAIMQPGSEYTFRLPASSASTISCRQGNDALDNERRTETWRPPSNEVH